MRRTAVDVKSVDRIGNATRIHYRFTPWVMVPNELIAQQAVYKVVCAIQRLAREDVLFLGHVRLIDDYGKRYYEPQVEIRLPKETVKKINCGSESSSSDINWRKVASTYKTHRLPPGSEYAYGVSGVDN